MAYRNGCGEDGREGYSLEGESPSMMTLGNAPSGSDTRTALSYFAIISFFSSIVVLTVFLFAFPLSLSFFGPIIKGQSNTKKFKSGKKYSNKLRTSYSAGGLSRTDAYPLAEKGRGARSGRLGLVEYRKSVRGPMHLLLKFFGRAPIWSSIEAVEYRGTTVILRIRA